MTARARTRANGEGSIFPYRNGFAAYAWVNKPDGTRDRKYVYGKTREIVHEKWIKLQQRAQEGPVPTRVPTVAGFVSYWLREVVEPNLAPATYVFYEGMSRLYLVPELGGKRLDRLQVRDGQAMINKFAKVCLCCRNGVDKARRPTRQRCCALGNCCGKKPSRTMLKGIRATLRAALTQAMTEELVGRNVAGLIKLPAGRKRRGSAWESDDARRFLEYVRAKKDPFYAAYVLVLVLGLRKGEVLGLTWDAIDLDKGELRVGWQLQRISKVLLRRETKTEESDDTLPLPEICIAALRLLRERQEAAKARAGETWLGPWQGWDLIFTTRTGLPIEPRNFSRAWDNRVAQAGVPDITVHDARRTCGSLLVDLDVHPRVIMQILRHADFSISMEIYSKVSSRQTREALKKLGESLESA